MRIIDIHYIEAVAEGSTATKESVMRRDCEQAAMLILSLLNKGGFAFEMVGEFQREARRVSTVADVRGAFDEDVILWRNIPAAVRCMQHRLARYDGQGHYVDGGFLLYPDQLQHASLAACMPGFGEEHRSAWPAEPGASS